MPGNCPPIVGEFGAHVNHREACGRAYHRATDIACWPEPATLVLQENKIPRTWLRGRPRQLGRRLASYPRSIGSNSLLQFPLCVSKSSSYLYVQTRRLRGEEYLCLEQIRRPHGEEYLCLVM